MNLEAWLALAATIGVQAIGLAFIYGRLTQKVTGHENTMLRHDREIEDHEATLRGHEGRIATIEGRISAGHRISHGD